jgi:hypothetical protein
MIGKTRVMMVLLLGDGSGVPEIIISFSWGDGGGICPRSNEPIHVLLFARFFDSSWYTMILATVFVSLETLVRHFSIAIFVICHEVIPVDKFVASGRYVVVVVDVCSGLLIGLAMSTILIRAE